MYSFLICENILFGSRNNYIGDGGKNVYDQSYGRPLADLSTRPMPDLSHPTYDLFLDIKSRKDHRSGAFVSFFWKLN